MSCNVYLWPWTLICLAFKVPTVSDWQISLTFPVFIYLFIFPVYFFFFFFLFFPIFQYFFSLFIFPVYFYFFPPILQYFFSLFYLMNLTSTKIYFSSIKNKIWINFPNFSNVYEIPWLFQCLQNSPTLWLENVLPIFHSFSSRCENLELLVTSSFSTSLFYCDKLVDYDLSVFTENNCWSKRYLLCL